MTVTFYLPTKIIFGAGSIKDLGVEANKLGGKAILVTMLPGLLPASMVDEAVGYLKNEGVEVLLYDKVSANPLVSTVDEGAKLVREKGIDLVIGLGGGSAMDAAKGIALASTGNKSIWDHIVSKIEVSGPVVPIILVPTFAATGSEANCASVITNGLTRDKALLISPLVYPKTAIVDPELTLTVPQKATAQGGVDIFCHAVEGYITTPEISPITDGIIETAMKTVVTTLPKVLTNLSDIQGRSLLSWASIIAHCPTVNLGGGFGFLTLHSIAVPLGGYFNAVHADPLAALLIGWMKYTLPVREERFRSLGMNVFGQEDGIAATEQWLDKVGLKPRLRDLGIEPRVFEEIAAKIVASGSTKNHPRPWDEKSIVKLYQDYY